MADQPSETFVERVLREMAAFVALWHRNKLLSFIVLGIGLAVAYPSFKSVFQPTTQTVELAFDPDRVFVIKALVKSPTTGKEHYDYFIKVDGDIWFEVYSEPQFFTRYMFKLVSIEGNELVLRDDTRNPNITVTIRINFTDKKIYYRQSDKDSEWPLYSIVRHSFIKS